MRLGSNFAVFVLFFGISLIEAIQSKNWLLAGLFFLVSLVFLFADNINKKIK